MTLEREVWLQREDSDGASTALSEPWGVADDE